MSDGASARRLMEKSDNANNCEQGRFRGKKLAAVAACLQVVGNAVSLIKGSNERVMASHFVGGRTENAEGRSFVIIVTSKAERWWSMTKN